MAQRGGARANAGRKPGYMVKLQREFITAKENEAEFAFAYIVAMMHGERKFDMGGFTTAREVMDRIWGRPAQTVRVKTWRDEIVALIREHKTTRESVREWFGDDLANELFLEAGVIIDH